MALINTTSGTAVEVIAREGVTSGRRQDIIITNTSAHANGAVVDLYIEDASANKYYYLFDITIPKSCSLEVNDVDFDGNIFKLMILNEGTSPSLSILTRISQKSH